MSMQSLLAASQSMAKMQAMQSARTQMQSTSNILRIESKQDGGDEKKEAQADALDAQASSAMNSLMTEATNVNEILKPDEDVKTEEASKEEEEAKKPPKTDTIELSDSAANYIDKEIHAKPAVLEAVTYDAGGSKTSSAPTNVVPTFEVTA